MDKHFTYFIILVLSLLGPLALSFDKKVVFYKKWPAVFKSILLPAILYAAWDIYFTAKGVWHFNAEYITGIKIANLPIEEVLFFFVIPYCCLFIYECIRVYFHSLKNKRADDTVLKILGLLMLITGIVFYKKQYTSWTFILNAAFITIIYINRRFFRHFNATAFIIAYSVILIPFLVVNHFLTSLPVVLYNREENLGLRIFNIPFEDIFYGMLLFMMNVAIYEKVKHRRRPGRHRRPVVNYSQE